jgi:hypothetical protein
MVSSHISDIPFVVSLSNHEWKLVTPHPEKLCIESTAAYPVRLRLVLYQRSNFVNHLFSPDLIFFNDFKRSAFATVTAELLPGSYGLRHQFPERFPVETGEGVYLTFGGLCPGWAGGAVDGGEVFDGGGE